MCHIRAGGFFLLAGFWRACGRRTPRRTRRGRPASSRHFAGSLTAVPAENLGVSGAFYVPVYSSVSMSQGKLRADFSVTLSIHNASETRPLVLKRIAYFDTAGKMVESYLKAPVALKPFSTIEVFIADHRRPRRHRRQFRGRLGGHRRDRRAGGRGADGRQRRHRALCLHQPGPADQDDRQELARTAAGRPAALSTTRTKREMNVHDASAQFDFTPLLPAGLPAPAARWTGLAKYSFVGGNNDPDQVPVDGLIDAVNAVLRREGKTLATYGLASGPQGYRPLREFLADKAQARCRHRLHRRRHPDRLRLAAGARPRQRRRCWRAAIP